jgi:glutathione reductase (NADPH)
VDEHFATSVPGVYAIGDVVGRLELTPVALAEGMALVDQLFGPRPARPRASWTTAASPPPSSPTRPSAPWA